MKTNRRYFNLVKGETKFGTLKAQSGEVAKLYLYDEISWFGVTAADFVGELSALNDVELHVNSPGGDVFEGLAMLNSLRAHPGKVTAIVDGIAASAASFLLMGADEVVMRPNTELMIHDAWGLCLGNEEDMRDTADRLAKVSDNIADIYAKRAGGELAEWRATMRAEKWYSPDEAVSAGLADRVDGGTGDSNLAFDLSKFKARAEPAEPAQVEELEWSAAAFLEALKGA